MSKIGEIIPYNEEYSYELFEDGYEIRLTGADRPIISQHAPFDKPMDARKTHEENAILQIEAMMTPPEPQGPTLEEKNRADIDYMSLMLDVTLPSEEEEGE